MPVPSRRPLSSERDRALNIAHARDFATDIALFDDVNELEWRGPEPYFDALGVRLDVFLYRRLVV
jgi:hypothetical protein